MIPFNRPVTPPTLLERFAEVARSGHHSGDGPMSGRASQMLRELHPGCAAVLLTTSCTHALELSALVLDIQPGDEVILPSFTFVSTANAFALRGARLRFADIDPTTLNLSVDSVRSLATEQTKVIVPVHYAGVGCDMGPLQQIANESGATIVEDNAHGLFGKIGDRALGTYGGMSTLSFHETKNISSGEGGALVINNPDLVARAEIAREKGTNRSQFFRGMVDKYSWVDLGSSWLPSEFTAASIVAGLEHGAVTQARRMEVWKRYESELADWTCTRDVLLPSVPSGRIQPAHMFYLLMGDLSTRTAFLRHMTAHNVHAVFHYVPLHSSAAAEKFADPVTPCPVTDDISERLVRLPLFGDISDKEVDMVIKAVRDF